ncbi:MAG: hypothetical protein OEQ49_10795 [Myxococcales bacterium]|nr:hypothetical protein [Myxococcales bacterium]
MSIARHGLWSVGAVSLALLVGCGDSGPSVPWGTGGTGGTGASGGVGATGGTGMGGSGGMAGIVGTGGMGGMVGTGGTGGTSGTGGTGGATGPCMTNALCHTCPTQLPCDTDDDCAFSGYVCVDSGCDTNQGEPIKQCQPLHGGSCASVTECPNSTDYACAPIGVGPTHCVRVTPGCSPSTESYDCPLGFSCEAGACVDRRVPCDSYLDCPKSHVCKVTPTADFCVRTFQTCHLDEDCAGLGEFCADIDNNGTKECAGGAGSPCLNASCPSTVPVCEVGAVATDVACGDYGLCRSNSDCDEAAGFECVGLWQDGRKECVRAGGTCDQVTDCDPQQVCAAPRNGGAPSCQAGTVP